MLIVRNLLYWVVFLTLTPLYSLLAIAMLPFPRVLRHRVVTTWTPLMLWWLRVTCGLKFEVEGAAHIPTQPAIIASQHQSGWETMALQLIFPRQVWVAKKELAWIPFFGWGLAAVSAILIDRNSRIKAHQQLIDQGQDRMKDGFWIVIFPEGTRLPPGHLGKFKHGGTRLAQALNVPLVPVALNSGEYWPKNAFLKHPGTIRVIIGEPLYPEGRSTDDITTALHAWIAAQQSRLVGQGPCAAGVC